MTDELMIEWIDNATYDQLLSRWRFSPIGSPFFSGKVGVHFTEVMRKRETEVGDAEHTAASKRIGWDR